MSDRANQRIFKEISSQSIEVAEERMRIILDNIEEIVHILDWEGRFLYLSPSWERTTGFSISSTVGNIFTPYAHPDDVPACLEFLKKVHITGQPQRLFQFRVKHASGKWIWFTNSGVAIKDENGVPLYFLGVGADITERKNIEESLAASEQRTRAILDNAEEVIYTLDWEGNFLFLSKAWEHITGHTVESTVGKSFEPHVHPDDVQVCINFLRKVYETGEPQKGVEFRVKHFSGDWVWFRSTGAAIKNPEGKPLYYVGVAMDITDRKRAEQERLEHERSLRQVQKLESLGVLAGGIAHDFNNILMAIMGYADLTLLNLDSGSVLSENISRIKKAAQSAAGLCQQMLAYAGKGVTVTEEIDLGKIIREMLHLLETSISKKIKLLLNLSPDLPLIEGGVTQIRQIILNLITNGSEAIGTSEGTITIETGVTDMIPQKSLSAFSSGADCNGPWITLEVSDSGSGMTPETMERIFDPFFSTKFTGRGLGMAAVQGIMRSHGGHITVESEKGKGTRFRLYFPASLSHIKSEEVDNGYSREVTVSSCCVLLVDDEKIVRDVCKSMLEALHHKVIQAGDGKEALTIFKEKGKSIDLIILDLTMPRMDGKETLKALRLIDPNVPVIISSGYSEIEIAGQFWGLELSDFIQKPYTIKKLSKAIEDTLKINKYSE